MTPKTALAPPPPEVTPAAPARDLPATLARAAVQVAWTARHPREPLAQAPKPGPIERLYYRALDGWEAPIYRLPPRPGASGEPVILAHDLGMGRLSLDYAEEVSLARALRDADFDVYLFSHRGDAGAQHPQGSPTFDFDDIATLDLPAALALVREISGAPRAHWVGHSMGALLAYAHAGRGGSADLGALVSLCAPVRFVVPRSQARAAGLIARLLPPGWSVPMRALHHAAAPFGGPVLWGRLAGEVDGALQRGLQLHATEDLQAGLVRQVARWVSSGAFCDRHDQIDYTAALRGVRTPALIVAAAGDPLCPPDAAEPAAAALSEARFVILPEPYGHLDVLVGRSARDEVFPQILDFLEEHRGRVW